MDDATVDWDGLHKTISTERHWHLRQGEDAFMGWLVETWEMLDVLRNDVVERTGADKKLLEALELQLFNERVARRIDPRTGERTWLPLWPDGKNHWTEYMLAPRKRVFILQELEGMDAQEIEHQATDLIIIRVRQG